jgi:hypothetical protein
VEELMEELLLPALRVYAIFTRRDANPTRPLCVRNYIQRKTVRPMTHVLDATLFWPLLGIGFLVAEAGITWLLIVLSTNRSRGGARRIDGS